MADLSVLTPGCAILREGQIVVAHTDGPAAQVIHAAERRIGASAEGAALNHAGIVSLRSTYHTHPDATTLGDEWWVVWDSDFTPGKRNGVAWTYLDDWWADWAGYSPGSYVLILDWPESVSRGARLTITAAAAERRSRPYDLLRLIGLEAVSVLAAVDANVAAWVAGGMSADGYTCSGYVAECIEQIHRMHPELWPAWWANPLDAAPAQLLDWGALAVVYDSRVAQAVE